MDDYTQAQAIIDAMEKCSCYCGCKYSLMNTKSHTFHLCFSCRHDLHYGAKRTDEARTDH